MTTKQLGRCGAYLLISLVFLSLGSAQDYVLRYFDLRELAHTPGVVRLSPDYQTVIEFQGLGVERVTSGRTDQILAEVVDNTIRLRANQYIVNTDLTVTAGGQTALFRLEGDAGTDSPRIYSVRNDPPPTRAPQGPPSGASSNGASSSDTSQTLGANSEAESANTEDDPRQIAAIQAPPEGTDFKASVYHSGEELVIQYALSNVGSSTLIADPARLSISYGDMALPYELTRVPVLDEPTQIPEGRADYGSLTIKNAPLDVSKLELKWTLFRDDSSRHHTLVRNLEAIPIGDPQRMVEFEDSE